MFDGEDNYRILIIEDGKLNQYVFRETLRSQYSLEVAETVQEAREKISLFRPHLIMLDIILPDANGFDFLKELKECDDTRSIPVIVITSLEGYEYEEKGLFLGAVDYIKKPFVNTIVKARVRTQIQLIKQMQMIEKLGLIDAMTDIPNRRSFDNQMRYEWGRAIRDKSVLSLFMMDVDEFKKYNDRYGHPQGDIMLQSVAKTIKSCLKRATDTPYRIGGEEFAVLLPGTDTVGAKLVAERIRMAVESMEVFYDGATMTSTTVSIGIATAHPTAEDSLSDFINRADQLLYQAKKAGRNRVQAEDALYSPVG